MPTTQQRPILDGCSVEPDPDEPGYFVVTPIWRDVDRPSTSSWCVRGLALAERLCAAVTAGVVCKDPEVRTDVNERTYVATTHAVMAKYANADLCRLGF